MGNKSSSSSMDYRRYGPPPGLIYPYPPPPFHQSMMSLHHPHSHINHNHNHPMDHGAGTDSGYMTSPTDSTDNQRWQRIHQHNNNNNHGSRMSLHEPFGDPQLPPNHFLLPPPDPKLIKKWHKKQKKLLKKLGPHAALIGPPPPPGAFLAPPPPPLPMHNGGYHRAFSVDNLNSGLLDGYSNVSLRKPRRGVVGNREKCMSSHFDEERQASMIPDVPSTRPRSTISSSDRGGFSFGGLRRTSTDVSSPSRVTNSSINDSRRRSPRRAPQPPSSSISPSIDPNCSSKTQINNNNNNNNNNDKDSVDSQRGSSSSTSNEHTDSINELLETADPPIKVTPEAQAILERNAKLFANNHTEKPTMEAWKSTNGANSHTRPIIATIPNKNQDENNVLVNDHHHQITDENSRSVPMVKANGYNLQRSERYSSFGSLTPSTANIQTGDIHNGDIDFSWVRDVESTLNQEHRGGKSNKFDEPMPVRYFGMEAQTEEFLRHPPIEAFTDEQRAKELANIRSHVKSKAAMFDMEAQHCQQRLVKEQRHQQQQRARSVSRDPFIPTPDYGRGEKLELSVEVGNDHPLPAANVAYRYFNGNGNGNGNHREERERTCSPSERRIRRFENMNGHHHNGGAMGNGYPQPEPQSKYPTMDTRYTAKTNATRLPADQITSPEVLQRNRRYDATEYYRNNMRPDRDNRDKRTSGAMEKSWRASVAY